MCHIELGIFDIIHDHGSPMTLPNLISASGIPKGKIRYLHRLMRILTHSGFCTLVTEQPSIDGCGGESPQEAYDLTTASQLLLKDNPSNISMRPRAELTVHPSMLQPYHVLSKWFYNDSNISPFEMQHGMSLWDYCTHNRGFNIVMNEAMASDSRVLKSKIIDKCRGSFLQSTYLVDVGGGTGILARGIADEFPHLEVIVLDLSHVICRLEGTMNLKFLAGDMFKYAPPANIILLKWILHDWDDNECVNILKRGKEAIMGNGNGVRKVIVIDIVMEDNKDDVGVGWTETELLFDIKMMTTFAGKERSKMEWAKLFADAGFANYEITPLVGSRCVIDVYP